MKKSKIFSGVRHWVLGIRSEFATHDLGNLKEVGL